MAWYIAGYAVRVFDHTPHQLMCFRTVQSFLICAAPWFGENTHNWSLLASRLIQIRFVDAELLEYKCCSNSFLLMHADSSWATPEQYSMQHKSSAAPLGAFAVWFKRDSEKAGWKVTSFYQAGRKFTSTNQLVLGLIQKVHALPGRSTCTAVKTNSAAHAAASDLISLIQIPTALAGEV